MGPLECFIAFIGLVMIAAISMGEYRAFKRQGRSERFGGLHNAIGSIFGAVVVLFFMIILLID